MTTSNIQEETDRISLDEETKRNLLAMYAMLEKKRQAPPPSVESVLQGLQEMGEEAQRNGLIPEILEDIQMQAAHKVIKKYLNAFSELAK